MCAPMSATSGRSAWSGSRASRLKNSITPMTRPSRRMGKPNAAAIPARSAAGMRGNSGCSRKSTTHTGSRRLPPPPRTLPPPAGHPAAGRETLPLAQCIRRPRVDLPPVPQLAALQPARAIRIPQRRNVPPEVDADAFEDAHRGLLEGLLFVEQVGQRKLRGEALLGLVPLGDVALDLAEARHLPQLVAHGHGGAVCEEPRPVFPHVPARVVRAPRGPRGLELALWDPVLAILLGEEHGEVPPDDVGRRVAHHDAGAAVPRLDMALRVHQEDGEVARLVDDEAEDSFRGDHALGHAL